MKDLLLIEIIPGIYVRPHTRAMDSHRMANFLVSKGIKTVLNVAKIYDAGLSRECPGRGITYQHSPLPDSRDLNDEQVRAIIGFGVFRAHVGGIVIHCDSGWNRSNLIAIPVAHRVSGEPTASILERVRQVRPKVLKNTVFEAFVLKGEF